MISIADLKRIPVRSLVSVRDALLRDNAVGTISDFDTTAYLAVIEQRIRHAAYTPLQRRIRRRTPRDLAQRRKVAGSGWMPPSILHQFTVGEQSALAIIAEDAIRNGACSLSIADIATRAHVCIRTVQNALRAAACAGIICVVRRKRRRQPHLTNVVTITSREWVAWLKRRVQRKPYAPHTVYKRSDERGRHGHTDALESLRKLEVTDGRESASYRQGGERIRIA